MSDDVTGTRVERLDALTTSYRDATETWERHRDRWQDAIVEAVDAGMKPADVGRRVGISPQRVLAIVARVYARE